MSPRTPARRLALCLAALAVFVTAGCNRIPAPGTGTTTSGPLTLLPDYQARAPRTCTPVTAPPSAATAAILVQCDTDGQAVGFLGLVQDVKLQFGKTRAFVDKTDATLPAIDVTSPVYPLQGSYTAYMCLPANAQSPAGHNCIKSVVTDGHGACYKSSFNDYRCVMHGNPPKMEQGVAGPTTF